MSKSTFNVPRNPMKSFFILPTAFAILSLLSGGLTLDGQEIDFEKQIAPIFAEHCSHCHGEDEQESGLRLDRRGQMLKGGDYGQPTIVPGKPEKSYLLDVINHTDEGMEMPPDEDKIPAAEIELLTRWITEGANWPGQMQALEAVKSDHWSFQPVVRPPVPETKFTNPVDAFLAKKLATENLSFSQSADALSLIRRASIVLTGIAPTPEQIADFKRGFKTNPDTAYEKLVDRLLASPQFGERWAQHWLDVIRWAETNGSESNLYRKNAWIYRDYVIRSFNENKPYDQFLREQIAGDTLGVGEATGYLVAGPHVPVATVGQEPSARRQARADRMDEILQTVGASALGMTIGCARCHNHKFDPISITDYYAMTAVFQDIEFGSRFPELSQNHPRRKRGEEIYQLIREQRAKLKETKFWEEDWIGYREMHFPSTKTQSVRISFQWGGARLDELEILGPVEWNKNLALASAGTKANAPEKFAQPRGELWKINDGKYGTEGWAAKAPKGSKEKPWVQFTFDKPQFVNRVRVSSNRQDFMQTDYLVNINKFNLGPFDVEILDENGNWKKAYIANKVKQLNNDKTHVATVDRIKQLILDLNDEGPKPSFVAKLVQPKKTFVLSRGSPENPRDEVFASGLTEINGDLNLSPESTGKQRRQAFANWLTSAEQPLSARVAVNRIWHHIFGTGIVATASDFGAAGARPTHPELLDWLASELVQPSVDSSGQSLAESSEQPWSMKRMIRLLVMSDAFRQSSAPRTDGLTRDAGSALLWRFPPRRMTAEAIRDSIVQASGSLNPAIGGKSYRIHNVKKRYAQWEVTDNHSEKTWRRMIYQERMRRVDDRMFTAFDFPDCGQVRPKRPVSTTPLQALNLLNSDFVIEQSSLIAQRAMSESNNQTSAAVNRCFELLLGRSPDAAEKEACTALAEEQSLTLVCRALLNSNEFAFLP